MIGLTLFIAILACKIVKFLFRANFASWRTFQKILIPKGVTLAFWLNTFSGLGIKKW
jgi:hypothetical protein